MKSSHVLSADTREDEKRLTPRRTPCDLFFIEVAVLTMPDGCSVARFIERAIVVEHPGVVENWCGLVRGTRSDLAMSPAVLSDGYCNDR